MVGAAAGALTGATMGATGGASAGIYGGLTGTGAGATQLAGTVVVGGAGSVLYGSGVAATTGQEYTYGDAANDFAWGASTAMGGGLAGTLAQRAAARTAGITASNCPSPVGGRLLWTSWSNYPKVVFDGQEYARIGSRLYSRHAVDRM